MKIDGEATLRIWSVDVEVAGATYTIPSLPASEWMLPLTSGSHLDIVPGLLEDPTALDDILVNNPSSGDECQAAARAAITAAAGCPWWSAARLARGIADTWIGGELALKGIDPGNRSLAAYLSAAYRVATRNLADDKRMRLDMELDQPPAGVPAEQWWDDTAAADLFMAAASQGS